jgi:hypothetical protein
MKKIFYSMLLLLAAGCKDRYDAPVVSPKTGYLVVEGNINSSNGPTIISISRTNPLNNRDINFEAGALVSVEGNDNSSYTLAESNPGQYSGTLNLNAGVKYRTNIHTTNGRQYISDFAEVKNNPPIDSISWQREHDGVGIYVNTHDAQNSTRYYQWEFTETWEFHSHFVSTLIYDTVPNTHPPLYNIMYRNGRHEPDSTLFICYKTVPASTITIGSTVALSNDIVFYPVIFIPPASWKLSVLYSIEVKQHTLTKEGFEYLEKMKKNTETTGSIFDAQPSELRGNIHNPKDPSEQVLGFINISPVQSKRIFISNDQLPGWSYSQDCYRIEVINDPDSIRYYGIGNMPTYPAKLGIFGDIISFYVSSAECVDCRLRGSSIKPVFWPK